LPAFLRSGGGAFFLTLRLPPRFAAVGGGVGAPGGRPAPKGGTPGACCGGVRHPHHAPPPLPKHKKARRHPREGDPPLPARPDRASCIARCSATSSTLITHSETRKSSSDCLRMAARFARLAAAAARSRWA